MVLSFKQQKQMQLSKKDISSIGKWDEKIAGLCEKLNDLEEYYTTSSCAGRVLLIKCLDKKAENVFLFRTHELLSFKELKKALREISYNGIVDFQQTTCILHVACFDLKSAQELVNKAKFAGWKHSGIMASEKRFMVELHSTEKLEFPIMSFGQVLVDDNFLKLLVVEANKRLERVWKKIEKLKKLI